MARKTKKALEKEKQYEYLFGYIKSFSNHGQPGNNRQTQRKKDRYMCNPGNKKKIERAERV